MRMSREDKEWSRTRIVDSAARLVRERGISGTGVADVMADAGLTHGGFYRHFDSKEALLAIAFDEAVTEMLEPLIERGDDESAATAVAEFAAHYLSDGHLRHPGKGCPISALGAEVARESANMQDTFGRGVQRVIDALAEGYSGTKRARRAEASRALAMMAGAVMIARASDKATADEVMAAAREALGVSPSRARRASA